MFPLLSNPIVTFNPYLIWMTTQLQLTQLTLSSCISSLNSVAGILLVVSKHALLQLCACIPTSLVTVSVVSRCGATGYSGKAGLSPASEDEPCCPKAVKKIPFPFVVFLGIGVGQWSLRISSLHAQLLSLNWVFDIWCYDSLFMTIEENQDNHQKLI